MLVSEWPGIGNVLPIYFAPRSNRPSTVLREASPLGIRLECASPGMS